MEKKVEIVICMGSSCFARGNKYNVEVIQKYLKEHNITEKVQFKGQLCTNNCKEGPLIELNGTPHFQLDEQKLLALLDEHFNQ